MTPTLIKLIIELSVLIALWSIARKTQEIDFLKEDMDDIKNKVDLLRGEIFQFENLSFKQKVTREEKRMNKVLKDLDHTKEKVNAGRSEVAKKVKKSK